MLASTVYNTGNKYYKKGKNQREQEFTKYFIEALDDKKTQVVISTYFINS